LNKKYETFQFKIHPLTGEIEINASAWLSKYSDPSELVYIAVNNLKSKSEHILKIFELLEIIPSESEENGSYKKLVQKI
jgi:hypothetical protein